MNDEYYSILCDYRDMDTHNGIFNNQLRLGFILNAQIGARETMWFIR